MLRPAQAERAVCAVEIIEQRLYTTRPPRMPSPPPPPPTTTMTTMTTPTAATNVRAQQRSFKIADLKTVLYRYVRPNVQLFFNTSQLTLFEEAFTHKSHGLNSSYERLEFLGDSVATCILTGYLFRRFHGEDEGFLTKLRSHLISGKVYAEVSRQVGLPGWLRLHPETEYMRSRPSAQEDVFEAFVGAVYLVFGYPIAEMWTVGVFEEHIDMSAVVRRTLNPRERLTNYCLSMFRQKPTIDVTDSGDGVVHARVLHPETAAVVAEAHAHSHTKAIADACDIASSAMFASYGRVGVEA